MKDFKDGLYNALVVVAALGVLAAPMAIYEKCFWEPWMCTFLDNHYKY